MYDLGALGPKLMMINISCVHIGYNINKFLRDYSTEKIIGVCIYVCVCVYVLCINHELFFCIIA